MIKGCGEGFLQMYIMGFFSYYYRVQLYWNGLLRSSIITGWNMWWVMTCNVCQSVTVTELSDVLSDCLLVFCEKMKQTENTQLSSAVMHQKCKCRSLQLIEVCAFTWRRSVTTTHTACLVDVTEWMSVEWIKNVTFIVIIPILVSYLQVV